MQDVTHLVVVIGIGVRLAVARTIPAYRSSSSRATTRCVAPSGKSRLKAVNGVSARTVRISRRIIRPTVRLRIQPISTALRIASPRRWNRQVANEYPKVRRTVSEDTTHAASTATVIGRLPARLERQEAHGQRAADDRHRQSAHADQGADLLRDGVGGADQGECAGERLA